jgi:hypothetical protein
MVSSWCENKIIECEDGGYFRAVMNNKINFLFLFLASNKYCLTSCHVLVLLLCWDVKMVGGKTGVVGGMVGKNTVFFISNKNSNYSIVSLTK